MMMAVGFGSREAGSVDRLVIKKSEGLGVCGPGYVAFVLWSSVMQYKAQNASGNMPRSGREERLLL
jgi:hypothetical protein